MTNFPESETALPETFDPATQEGSKFNLLPVDWYKAQVTDASVSQTKSGDGWLINLTWQITEDEHEGRYKGRYVFQRITFIHSSTQAVEIGRRQFKDLCVATGVDEQVTDVAVFKFIPCQIRIGVESDKRGLYDDTNRVSRILPIDAPIKPAATAKAVTAKAATAKAAKPAKPTQSSVPSPTTAASATATVAPAAKSASNAASSADGNVPPWRQTKPSPSKELDDEIPF